MHPFMCARIIHHLVVVGHILHNLQELTIWTRIRIYYKILYINYDYFFAFKYFCCCQFESDVEAEFIDLIEYTAKICNKAVRLWGIIERIKMTIGSIKDLL